MKRSIQFLAVLLASSLCSLAVESSVDEVIAKARERLGGDQALDAIQSIHYTGSIDITGEGAEANATHFSIDIIVKKPSQQRLTIRSPKGTDITGLDDYIGWRRTEDASTPPVARSAILQPEQIKRLRANVWEQLSYYHGPQQHDGQIVDGGVADVGGVTTRKLTFKYGPDIEFVRYIDPATGRLVLTENQPNGQIREEGEVIVNGVRFPQKLITVTKNADGKERVVTVLFDKITTNEVFPASQFMPPLSN